MISQKKNKKNDTGKIIVNAITKIVPYTIAVLRNSYHYGNREISQSHARKLSDSIKKNGLLQRILCVYDLKGKLVVIDGQHRVEALFILGIVSVEIEIRDPNERFSEEEILNLIISLNHGKKIWGTLTFIDSLYKHNYSPAIDIINLRNKFNGLGDSMFLSILADSPSRTDKDAENFKNRTYTPHYTKAVKWCTRMIEFLKAAGVPAPYNQRLTEPLYRYVRSSGFDIEKVREAMKDLNYRNSFANPMSQSKFFSKLLEKIQ